MRALGESTSCAAGLLAAILPIRVVTRHQFVGQIFGDFLMVFVEVLPNSGKQKKEVHNGGTALESGDVHKFYPQEVLPK